MISAEAEALLQLLPEPALVVTPTGRIVASNAGCHSLLGGRQGCAPGRTLEELTPGAPDQWRAFLDRCSSTGQLVSGPMALAGPNGQTLPWHCEAACLSARDAAQPLVLLRFTPQSQEPEHLLQLNGQLAGLHQQIARRHQAEAALRQSESLFRQLVDTLPQMVWTATPDGSVDYFNQRWYEFTGLSKTAGDEGWRSVLHPEDVPRVVSAYEQSVQAGQPFEMEYRMWDRQCQSYRWFLGRAVPLHEPSGRTLRWVGTNTDIDELKRAGEARGRLVAIVESSTDAIASKTTEGIVTSWNKSAERIFGYTAEEMIGKPIAILIPEDHHDEEPHILERIKRGERIDHYTTVRRRKDGTLIEISLSVSPLKDSAGNIIGASKIARDITRQRQTERALAKAQEELRNYAATLEQKVQERTAKLQETIHALDSFCYTIAHDLRAPLRALGGFSKMLREDYAPLLDEQGNEYLQRIGEAATRMDQLILDLLRLGQVSTAKLISQTVDVAALIQRALRPLEAEIESKGAQVRVHAPLLPLHANPVLLEQILANLLGNALKFNRPEVAPVVEIWTEETDGQVRLHVRDNGIGMNPGHLHTLFQPFSRLVSREQYSGTGMGLAIVRQAAERMGGRVGVSSTPGQGSCFWLELPAARATSPPAEAPARSYKPGED